MFPSCETRNNLLYLLADYRIGMRITHARQLPDGTYYVCPRCLITLDRDYQKYCDRCGQRLDWRGYRKVSILRSKKPLE